MSTVLRDCVKKDPITNQEWARWIEEAASKVFELRGKLNIPRLKGQTVGFTEGGSPVTKRYVRLDPTGIPGVELPFENDKCVLLDPYETHHDYQTGVTEIAFFLIRIGNTAARDWHTWYHARVKYQSVRLQSVEITQLVDEVDIIRRLDAYKASDFYTDWLDEGPLGVLASLEHYLQSDIDRKQASIKSVTSAFDQMKTNRQTIEARQS